MIAEPSFLSWFRTRQARPTSGWPWCGRFRLDRKRPERVPVTVRLNAPNPSATLLLRCLGWQIGQLGLVELLHAMRQVVLGQRLGKLRTHGLAFVRVVDLIAADT